MNVADLLQELLASWGWSWAWNAEGQHCAVQQVPLVFEHAVPAASFPAFVDTAAGRSARQQQRIPDAVHTLLQSVACRGAIMFGDQLAHEQQVSILQGLARTRLPFHCAHGRPTTAVLASKQRLQTCKAGERMGGTYTYRGVCGVSAQEQCGKPDWGRLRTQHAHALQSNSLPAAL